MIVASARTARFVTDNQSRCGDGLVYVGLNVTRNMVRRGTGKPFTKKGGNLDFPRACKADAAKP